MQAGGIRAAEGAQYSEPLELETLHRAGGRKKAPAGFEPIGAGVHLEFFAASMSIKNGMSRI